MHFFAFSMGYGKLTVNQEIILTGLMETLSFGSFINTKKNRDKFIRQVGILLCQINLSL